MIFMWLFGISVAAFTVLIVFLFLYFIKPAKESPAIYFIEAKRKNKIVVALDAGSHWLWSVNEYIDGDILRDKNDNIIKVTPNSLKYSKGVLFGCGEAYRSKLANAAIISLINEALSKKMTIEQISDMINVIEKKFDQVKEEKYATNEKNQPEPEFDTKDTTESGT